MCIDYACGPDACKTSCASDLDCVNDDYCDASKCKPRCQTPTNDNLVPNAGFDRTNWTYDGTPENASMTFWQSTDSTGCANSGSARVGPGGIFSDCFPVQPGKSYFFGFMYRAPNLNNNTQNCGVGWYDDVGCANVVSPGTFAGPVAGSGWQKTPSFSVVVPANATHAKIACINFETSVFFEVDRAYYNAVAPAF
ncbi:MAG: hypothetical protein QOI66_3410 [Myxococcales bacterium]|jgi:hypothetical protein|nr:hypothetical protein [Myxococcales bacterium]